MGNRAQVLIEDTGVWLYTHWGADELPELVREILKRGERWDDPEYLARMIFSRMIRDDIDGELGFGIGTRQHSDVYRVVMINCELKQVTLMIGDSMEEINYCESNDFPYILRRIQWKGSFEDFVNASDEWEWEA